MAGIVMVWVVIHAINPEWQVPIAVYARKEDALADGHTEDDIEEVMFYA
jgi:sulfur transfer complex TusBCD TusB component (DsrH family)